MAIEKVLGINAEDIKCNARIGASIRFYNVIDSIWVYFCLCIVGKARSVL